MTPNGSQQPAGALEVMIMQRFADLDHFKDEFRGGQSSGNQGSLAIAVWSVQPVIGA